MGIRRLSAKAKRFVQGLVRGDELPVQRAEEGLRLRWALELGVDIDVQVRALCLSCSKGETTFYAGQTRVESRDGNVFRFAPVRFKQPDGEMLRLMSWRIGFEGGWSEWQNMTPVNLYGGQELLCENIAMYVEPLGGSNGKDT